MAITKSTFTPDPVIIPWTTVADPAQTIAPRAEVVFPVNGETITAGGAGNEQQARIICNLPQNFAYALMDINMGIFLAAAGTCNWDAQVGALMRPLDPQDERIWLEGNSTAVLNGDWISTGTLTEGRVYCFNRECFPKQILKSGAQATQLTIIAQNMTQNDAAAYCYGFIRFLMYDINQAQHWQSNAPTLTR